jgi:flavin-dependent dehydrogenase
MKNEKDDDLSARLMALPPEKRALYERVIAAQSPSVGAASDAEHARESLGGVDPAWEVVIMGGGLAGLALALQLKQRRPGLKVLVVEKAKHPVPEAAHKVGESTVEVAAHYFGEVLGQKRHLQTHQLRKLGLRFFFGQQDNLDIARRLEVGPFISQTLPVPSYQLDRGRFENFLGEECRRLGISFLDGCSVSELELRRQGHTVTVSGPDGQRNLSARWVVDAAGRAALIKRRLRLAADAGHDVNAAWFRVSVPVDLEDWSEAPAWRARMPAGFRQFSTNHLMGPGYWVWLIPLASGSTSIGVVADGGLHPISTINSLEKVYEWLRIHEPRCYQACMDHRDIVQDFIVLKRYAHGCKQVFSTDRWTMVGESGVFTDPFYSPGSDFIAFSNTITTDLILRDLDGEPIEERVAFYSWFYLDVLFAAAISLFRRQYPIMGNPQVMTAKLVWDFAVYWNVVGPLFLQGVVTELEVMQSLRGELERWRDLQVETQRFFRAWHDEAAPREIVDRAVDFTRITFLYRAHCGMKDELTRPELVARIRANIDRLEVIAAEFRAMAARDLGRAPAEPPPVAEPGRDVGGGFTLEEIRRDMSYIWSTAFAPGEAAKGVA